MNRDVEYSNGETWLRFGRVIDGTGTVRRDAAVAIADGKILRIVDGASVQNPDIDRPDHTLVPGFIDAHVHLTFGYEDTHESVRSKAEFSSVEFLYHRALRHAQECIEGGVTTVRDCGDREFLTSRVRKHVRGAGLPSPDIFIAGPALTIENGHLNWCGSIVRGPEEIAPTVQNLRRHGADFVKVLASGGSMTSESNPLQPQFGLAELEAIVREAAASGMKVAAHAHSVDAIRVAAQAGVHSIEHCSWWGHDGKRHVLDDVVDMIVRKGIFVTLTMAGIQRVRRGMHSLESDAQDPDVAETGNLPLDIDFAWARTMHQRGAKIVFASDAGVRFTPFRAFMESIRCGQEALQIPAAEAISHATLVPAEALGIDGRVGTIAPGKDADLVSLAGLVDERGTGIPEVSAVWKRGVPVGVDTVC